MPKTINVGFEEYIEDNVQELITTMPWMKETDMKLCSSAEQLSEFVTKAISLGKDGKKPYCCVDFETTGLNTRMIKGKPAIDIVGVALAIDKNTGIYVPVHHKEGKEFNISEHIVLEEIKRLCKCCIIIVHNAKFDVSVLRNFGIVINDFEEYEDTLILARLFDAGQKQIDLKTLSKKLLNRPMIELKQITKGTHRLDMISPKIGYVYGASDALCTFGLFDLFMQSQIINDQKAVYNLEKRLVFVVMQMESNLVLIDKEYLLLERIRIEGRLKQIEDEIHTIADDKEFNIGSTQQLGRILFEKLQYDYPSKTKTASGQYMTDTKTLEKIEDKYPMIKLIIEYRELEKALGTYINNLLDNCDEDSCVKLSFNQNGTDTGRFSSPGGHGLLIDGYSAVNVQAIPANYSASAPDIRKAFKARPGKKIVAMDFSGEELRVAANLSGETKWIDEFLYGSADLHTATGKAIYKKEEISKAERQVSKCVARGTLIASERGWISIEKLKKGDLVYTHKLELKPVKKVWHMGTKSAITISTKRLEITCGVNHRFLRADAKDLINPSEEDWIKAKDIKKGQRLLACFKNGIEWESKTKHKPTKHYVEEVTDAKKKSKIKLMDLTIEGDHTYVAQGFVTHNTTNFLVLYGGGSKGLAEQARLSETEARRILSSFFEGLPRLKKWIERERATARRQKFARTVFGRVRPLHMFYESGDKGLEAHADRCATNFLVQGCCADIMKVVMVRVASWIKENNLEDEIKILITMHDELVFEMPEDKLEIYIPQLNNIMCLKDILQDVFKWPVPLTIDAEYGDTWHVDHDLFKEKPELRDSIPAIEFHQSAQVVEHEIPKAPEEHPFFDVILTEEQYQKAAQVGKLRESQSRDRGCQQAYGAAGPDLAQDIMGAAGEFAYCIYTNQPWSESVNTFKAPDVGVNVQIRTTTVGDGKRRLIVREQDRDEDLFVLVLAEDDKFKIVGSILGKDAKQDKFLDAPNGRSPAWFVDQGSLSKVVDRRGIIEHEIKTEELATPILTMESPKENTGVSELPEEIIYKIKDRTRTNLRRVNDIITFLTDDCENEVYKGPVSVLKIYDKDGNILSVSNLKVRSDCFYALARFMCV